MSSTSPYVSLGSRLFALIIGINNYKAGTFPNLRGATGDADAFISYLKESLRVPEKQIKVLLNENATRMEIVDGFAALAADSSIQEGDPIVIFFAGHGAEQEVAGLNGRKIQVIVPHDFSRESGKEVEPIRDLELQRMIGQIAVKKGDNITVILDCCHSASGTRELRDSSLTIVRSIEIDEPFDAARDADLQEDKIKVEASQALDLTPPAIPALQSHMLISACSASEQAKETSGRGNFSVALIKLLQLYSPDKLDLLKYSEILTHMDRISGQNPQCEGNNQHRPLFHSQIPISPERRFQVALNSSERPTIKAGAANGITPGAEFAIYAAHDRELEKALTYATVDSTSIEVFHATLQIRPQAERLAADVDYIAVQTKLGDKEDLRLWIQEHDAHAKRLIDSVLAGESKGLYSIILVNERQVAHLGVSFQKNAIVLQMADERVTKHSKNSYRFPPVDADVLDHRLQWVVSHAAHFFRELDLVNDSTTTSLSGSIQVGFYELDSNTLKPKGNNLCNAEDGRDGVIKLFVDDKAEIPYGLSFTNTSHFNLHPYVFLFDSTDLSIVCHYKSPSSQNENFEIDAPLRKGGAFSIGYDIDSGCDPIAFALNEGHTAEVTFLKIILSTRPIDVEHIPQDSPFEFNRSPKKWQFKKDRWDTKLIPIVQCRKVAGR
ncbi:hypothetical protein CVT26_010745 [Gymnopilus dilepis]|uniref:Peptidase C14 caspase domain-containing protein n=1 Tax=Gymnopilus dilepis TaxID=231916 RepID=A0A409Y0U1_9AGAR|nr:hypothetical protein CVT26_010745 [Gymnopilus dilepis]